MQVSKEPEVYVDPKPTMGLSTTFLEGNEQVTEKMHEPFQTTNGGYLIPLLCLASSKADHLMHARLTDVLAGRGDLRLPPVEDLQQGPRGLHSWGYLC